MAETKRKEAASRLVKDFLEEIHDEADHIVNTEEDGLTFRTVATCNAESIKSMAKSALKLIGEG